MQITGSPFHEDNRLHLFSRDIAAQNYGGSILGAFDIEGAILLTDIARNIHKIKAYRDARKAAYRKTDGWYYISVKDLAKRHPYMTERSVRRTLARLRKAGILRVTKELHKHRTEHTLWYSFADRDLFKEALAKEGAISFWVQDALDYGVEAAMLLKNLSWRDENNFEADGTWDTLHWTSVNPVEFLDHTNLPMSARALRRALTVLVKGGRVERRRNKRFGRNYYLYRLVDTPHLTACEESDALPTECYHRPVEDDLPSEVYDNLPPTTAQTEAKDKENRLLKEFAEQVRKAKAYAKSRPTQAKRAM